ncbi:hypothetical protein ABK040_003918 [Willaertia magna]
MTLEVQIFHALQKYDRLLFNGLDEWINSFPWLQENYHYCHMYHFPESKRTPFPFLLSILSLAACFLLFFLSKLLSPLLFKAYRNLKDDADREKWDVKFVSALHAAFVFQGAVRSLIEGGGIFFNPNNPSDYTLLGMQPYACGYYSELGKFYETITFGYMFYDFWVCIRAYGFTLEGVFPSLVIHHFNIMISFLLGIKLNIAFFYTLSFMTNEISQPFLHLSWFLIKSKVPVKHPVSIVNGLLLVTTFIGSRFFVNLFIFYHFVKNTFTFDPRNCVGMGALTAAIHVACNWHWSWLMVKQITEMFGKKKPQQKSEENKEKKE